MSESLDERARTARQSITDVTADVEDREFDPPARPIGTVAGVVFATLLAAGGIWAIGRSDDPQAAEVAADGPDSISVTEDADAADDPEVKEATEDQAAEPMADAPPVEAGAYLVFDPPPEGFDPIIVVGAGVPIDEIIPTFDIYGSEGNNPFADGDLLVASIALDEGDTLVTDPETPTVEVDGEVVHLESDEGFNVVSWQVGNDGVGLLSYSLSQDELLEIMTGLIRTGEVDNRGLSLIQEDVAFSEAQNRFFGPVVLYNASNPDFSTDAETVITGMLINSEPSETSLLQRWFSTPFAEDTSDIETVEHNGLSIAVSVSIERGRSFRFELDGVPIEVTMLGETGPGAVNDQPTLPSMEDALALLGNIRGATEAEVEEMKAASGFGG